MKTSTKEFILYIVAVNLIALGAVQMFKTDNLPSVIAGWLGFASGSLIMARLTNKPNHAPQGSNQIQIPKEMVHLAKNNCIYNDIQAEIIRAQMKFPQWPNDPVRAAAILAEESGELVKAVNELCDEPHKTSLEEVRAEALQTAAMAIRFLHSLDRYDFKPSEQHDQ